LGLGLVISRSIVEAHQGIIFADSPGPGKGATFTLELPLIQPAVVTKNHVHPPLPAAKGPRPRKILLVEDHHDTRASLEHLLRKEGYQVFSAGSVGEALALATANQIDLVVSDLR